MGYMKISRHAQAIINAAYTEARMRHHEYLTPEHLLYAALNFEEVKGVLNACGGNVPQLKTGMENFFEQKIPVIDREPSQTVAFQSVLERAVIQTRTSQRDVLDVADILVSLYDEEQNFCAYYLRKSGIHRLALLKTLSHGLENEDLKAFFRSGQQTDANDVGLDGETGRTAKKKSALDRFTTELTALAKEGRLEPVIGRDPELDRTIQVLCRRMKNNPVHVGDAGVGKTAITEGLASRIANGNVPPPLQNCTLYSLDMGALVAGTRFRGDFEARVKIIIDEILKKQNAILFIDEIHTMVGAGSASGTLDASNLLKPVLTSGKLRCIGSTTFEEYNKYFEKDRALSRRFQKIDINEPSEDDAIKILQGLKPKYEDYHRVHYSDEALSAAVKLSAQYINERRLPDKAIDVIDEAGAFARINVWKENLGTANSATSIGGEARESGLCADGENALSTDNVGIGPGARSAGGVAENTAAPLAGQGVRSEGGAPPNKNWDKIRAKQEEMAGSGYPQCPECDDDDVYDGGEPETEVQEAAETESVQEVEYVDIDLRQIESVVARIARIPEKSVGESERDKLRYLDEKLKTRVFGQDEAVKTVVQSVKRSRAGFRDPQKPVANFLFAGPTGVGKTELSRSLADILGLTLHRFDMSEYQEKHTISRLIGSPPGYVGYEEGGLLTEAVRKHPHCVLLLDEIEKAHADIFNVLLQIMDYATLTDNNGRKADFRNAVLIMTSNAGARDIGKNLIGFGERVVGQETAVNDAVEKLFTPEFRGRLDAVIRFDHLSQEIMIDIVGKNIEEFKKQLNEKNIRLTVSDACIKKLAEDCYNKESGARNAGRIIEEKIKAYFVDEVLFGALCDGGSASVDYADGEYKFKGHL
ncbi:MAG: ATP-dependent chaperone ClpB [Termitinemataceae bacterium]|nr:MAG: ATP-dependent chaperone ClpB [Termitinemataceae bacterium]